MDSIFGFINISIFFLYQLFELLFYRDTYQSSHVELVFENVSF